MFWGVVPHLPLVVFLAGWAWENIETPWSAGDSTDEDMPYKEGVILYGCPNRNSSD